MALDTANLCILTGNANPDLAKKIADHIGVNLCDAYVGHFNNGETQVMISESIRGKDIFIIQPTSYPVNDNLMELLIMADACKRASAHSITAVVPYYAYARQDRKTRGREPISAKLVANLMTTAGVTRVVTVDLHAGQIQGFFDIPVDHLAAAPVIANYFRAQKFDDVVVVSPDLGGVTRARILADHLQAPIAIIEKRGAKRIFASCSHAILSDPAVQRINESPIEKLVITDTIPLPPEKQSDKFVVLSLADALGDVMMRIQSHRSVSQLFR